MFDWAPNAPSIGGAVNVGGGRLQVHGICNHRLMYSEAVAGWLNYKEILLAVTYESCLWWFDSAVSNWTVKDQVRVAPRFVWRKGEKPGEEEVACFRMCGAPLIGLVLVLLMSFSRMVIVVLVLKGVGSILSNGYGI